MTQYHDLWMRSVPLQQSLVTAELASASGVGWRKERGRSNGVGRGGGESCFSGEGKEKADVEGIVIALLCGQGREPLQGMRG
jgi:hypothetical protein